MKTIKGTSKRGKDFIRKYENSRYSNLYECYAKPSQDKLSAKAYCYYQMKVENGKNFRILSYNTFQFTCGWMTDNGLRVETANNSYLIELTNEQYIYL